MQGPIKFTRVVAAGMAVSALAGLSLAQQDRPRTPPGEPAMQAPNDVAKGYIAAPPGSETLNATLDPESLQLFESEDFKGTESTVAKISRAAIAGAPGEFPNGLNDSVSSLRWNLPPGMLVVLYEDVALKGEQMLLWGKGQMANLHKVDFDNKPSRWTWYDAGGGTEGYSSGSKMRPQGSQNPTALLPADTVQLFIDKEFKNTMKQVSPVTGQKAGELNTLPSELGDSLTSVRWNLPDGVIVMFYQDADGKKQQIGIWNMGEVADLDTWDMNDKASRWSWAYIGDPTKKTTPSSPSGQPGSVRP